MTKTNRVVTLLILVIIAGCTDDNTGTSGWISGDADERWAIMAMHLRGLDVAMVEIDYRYHELYWAGQDENWPYAEYQQKKIGLALENALLRRPQRRASAENLFLDELEDVKSAVAEEQRAAFEMAFAKLTAACNSCHAAEGVASFLVNSPLERRSSIAITQ